MFVYKEIKSRIENHLFFSSIFPKQHFYRKCSNEYTHDIPYPALVAFIFKEAVIDKAGQVNYSEVRNKAAQYLQAT